MRNSTRGMPPNSPSCSLSQAAHTKNAQTLRKLHQRQFRYQKTLFQIGTTTKLIRQLPVPKSLEWYQDSSTAPRRVSRSPSQTSKRFFVFSNETSPRLGNYPSSAVIKEHIPGIIRPPTPGIYSSVAAAIQIRNVILRQIVVQLK